MTGNKNHIKIITLNASSLNVNGLNSSIKRHRLTDWIKKKNPTICCQQETHLIEKGTHTFNKGELPKTFSKHS